MKRAIACLCVWICIALTSCSETSPRPSLVLAGVALAAAGDVACIATCGQPAAEAATDVGIAALGAAALLGIVLYELTKDDGPRN